MRRTGSPKRSTTATVSSVLQSSTTMISRSCPPACARIDPIASAMKEAPL